MSRKQTKIEQSTQVAIGGGRLLTILIFSLPWLSSRFWISIDLIFITFVFWVMMVQIHYVMALRDTQRHLVELRGLLNGKFRDDPLVEELKLFLNQADLWAADQTK